MIQKIMFKMDKRRRRERDFRPNDIIEAAADDHHIHRPRDHFKHLKHGLLEAMASIIFTYAALYIPESESDYLKQYVTSISIFAVTMTMKDSHYFFPDGTPTTTIMLWAATLYTDIRGNTKVWDIIARITGQVIGWAIVFWLAVGNKQSLQEYSVLFSYDDRYSAYAIKSPSAVNAIHEGLATMLECVTTTYAIIPLVSPYYYHYHDDNDDDDDYDDNEIGGGGGIESKMEADPPHIHRLCKVALSLAAIHYILERIFQATMNPLHTILQLYIRDELSSHWYGPLVGQIIGIGVACIYVSNCKLAPETMKKLLNERRREHGKLVHHHYPSESSSMPKPAKRRKPASIFSTTYPISFSL